MATTDLQRAGNELGARTTYQLFLEREDVPAVRGFHVEDINSVELYPWARMGGRGVFLNLDGSEGVNDCYICEIAPGRSSEPQRHMFEELVYVVSGRGATTVWQDGGKKQTFEWGGGAFLAAAQCSVSAFQRSGRPAGSPAGDDQCADGVESLSQYRFRFRLRLPVHGSFLR